jgi:hypothetical protein
VNIQTALFDQKLIRHGIKVTVIDHVVDMTIDIVIHPAGSDIGKIVIATTLVAVISHRLKRLLVD